MELRVLRKESVFNTSTMKFIVSDINSSDLK